MNIIIGDIGNTVTKICLINEKSFVIKKKISLSSEEILTTNIFKKKINKFLKNEILSSISLFSSVVPKYNKIIKIFLKKIYKIKLVEIKENKVKKIINLNIVNKNQLGSDRIANSVGVYKKYKTNCIVVDFGTATTFDVVTKKGSYIGGVIAPGVNLSIKTLTVSADQIPFFSIKRQKKIIGKNTREALNSGFYWGYSGLINNIISKIEKGTQKKYKVIFTGGYADLFKTSIKRTFTVDKNITISGIIEIYKKNIRNLIK